MRFVDSMIKMSLNGLAKEVEKLLQSCSPDDIESIKTKVQRLREFALSF